MIAPLAHIFSVFRKIFENIGRQNASMPWLLARLAIVLVCMWAVMLWFNKCNVSAEQNYDIRVSTFGEGIKEGHLSVMINDNFSSDFHTLESSLTSATGDVPQGITAILVAKTSCPAPPVITDSLAGVGEFIHDLAAHNPQFRGFMPVDSVGPLIQISAATNFKRKLLPFESVSLDEFSGLSIVNDCELTITDLNQKLFIRKTFVHASSQISDERLSATATSGSSLNDSVVAIPQFNMWNRDLRSSLFQQFFSFNDLSKAIVQINFNLPENFRLLSFGFSTSTVTEFLPMYPKMELQTLDAVLSNDPETLNILKDNGVLMYLKFPDMEGLQVARNFFITTLLSLLIAELFHVLYLLVRPAGRLSYRLKTIGFACFYAIAIVGLIAATYLFIKFLM